jgi:hypothetical protein
LFVRLMNLPTCLMIEVCKLWSHQFGWELCVFIGSQDDIVQTQVCRSQGEVLTTGEQ